MYVDDEVVEVLNARSVVYSLRIKVVDGLGHIHEQKVFVLKHRLQT